MTGESFAYLVCYAIAWAVMFCTINEIRDAVVAKREVVAGLKRAAAAFPMQVILSETERDNAVLQALLDLRALPPTLENAAALCRLHARGLIQLHAFVTPWGMRYAREHA